MFESDLAQKATAGIESNLPAMKNTIAVGQSLPNCCGVFSGAVFD
jgi:hypothetical protein